MKNLWNKIKSYIIKIFVPLHLDYTKDLNQYKPETRQSRFKNYRQYSDYHTYTAKTEVKRSDPMYIEKSGTDVTKDNVIDMLKYKNKKTNSGGPR